MEKCAARGPGTCASLLQERYSYMVSAMKEMTRTSRLAVIDSRHGFLVMLFKEDAMETRMEVCSDVVVYLANSGDETPWGEHPGTWEK